MRPALAALLGAGLFACSNISGDSDGVVALELRLPSPAAVEPGDTLILRARALDKQGDSIAATVVWLTPDTSLLSLDSLTGRAATDSLTGTARVQAHTGTLLSDVGALILRPRSDTLVLVGSDTVRVLATDTISAPLVAAVLTNNPAGTGVAGTSIVYQTADSSPATAQGVRFPSGGLTYRATTGADGQPLTPATLRRIAGGTAPDSVIVVLSAARPSGAPVPGSGQMFIVRFD